MLLRRAMFLLASLVVLASLTCRPALADPALWVAKSPMATVYLFGTVHVLPDNAKWHYPALDKALVASGKLYVEEDDDSPATMRNLILEYGMGHSRPVSGRQNAALDRYTVQAPYVAHDHVDPSYALSSRLDARDQVRLEAAARGAGLPGGVSSLERLQPWLAAITLTEAPIEKAGYEPQSGADKQLERQFKVAGKPIGAFETAEEQIRFFANLSPSLQMDLLRNTLDDYAEGPAQIKALIGDWQAGNVAAIAETGNGGMRDHYPGLYQVLLVNRNRNWAKQIVGLLEQPGTIFVAVGAGHLAGPDSVQAQLAKIGVKTERVH